MKTEPNDLLSNKQIERITRTEYPKCATCDYRKEYSPTANSIVCYNVNAGGHLYKECHKKSFGCIYHSSLDEKEGEG